MICSYMSTFLNPDSCLQASENFYDFKLATFEALRLELWKIYLKWRSVTDKSVFVAHKHETSCIIGKEKADKYHSNQRKKCLLQEFNEISPS